MKFVASVMNGSVKGDDMLARYGGEEFVVLLPLTELENAKSAADNIRLKIAGNKLINNKNQKSLGHITVSIGVAACTKTDDCESIA